MFCYQREFSLPTETVTQQLLRDLVSSPQTRWFTKEHRRWRDNMPSILADDQLQTQWAKDEEYQKWCIKQENDHRFIRKGVTRAQAFKAMTLPQRLQAYCAYLKMSLPYVVFIGTFDESEGGKKKTIARWRKQKYCRLNGLCVIDFDHVDERNDNANDNANNNDNANDNENSQISIREIWEEAYAKLSDEDKARILFVYVTPSGHGLKVVFTANANVGNLIDNQIVFSKKLGLNPDESCKDASRGAFLTTKEDIIFINEEKLITYEDEEFGKKYNEEYHAGKSQATIKTLSSSPLKGEGDASPESCTKSVIGQEGLPSRVDLEESLYNGIPFQKIIDAWSKQRFCKEGVSRHEASVVLARDLYIMTDRDKQKTLALLMAQPWVKQIVEERNEDVERTVNNAADYVAAQENENAKKGKAWLPRISKEMAEIVRSEEQIVNSQLSIVNSPNLNPEEDVYDKLPLGKWAEELQEMAKEYPCMKELFLNVHPYKLPAVWFSSAALFGTLMTRAWYRFWYDPEIIRRLNYCIFIIGDPGAGKNVVDKFYRKIADPMIQADQAFIDAVNRYKEGRTERTTSTKAQKGEPLKRPVVGIRVHPARTALGEFIRHMIAAVETVEGKQLSLHMLSFDAELDNATTQNKGGDWKNREVMELKAFHNEEDGQMYGNQDSYTGMLRVFWNFIYTGTPYALHRKVNQRNFGTGMSTRLAVIPLPDKGQAQRHQEIDPDANETLKTWAYRLDKVEGELPIEPLNDETYEWQSSHMEIAEFNGDKADRMLLKRIPYYGIGISLPYILMRHWDEWQEKKTLTMDEMDKRLCRLAMEIQYRCQQFFFGEMAYNYFEDQNKEFVVRRRTGRYGECFRKLPEEFNTQKFMEVFECTQSSASRAIKRFIQDQLVERVQYGVYKKVVSELP